MIQRKLRFAAIIFVVVGLILLGIYASREGLFLRERPAMVRVYLPGEETVEFETLERIPANWLAQAGLPLYPGDVVVVSGVQIPSGEAIAYAPVYDVEVIPAKRVTLDLGDEQEWFYSGADTVGEALWEAGISLREGDLLSTPPETPLEGSLSVSLVPSRLITVVVDGKTLQARITSDTVGEALAEAGVALQGLDISVPAENQPLPEDGRLQVVRVVEEVVIAQETIPFETKLQADPETEIDTYSLVQAGEYGLETSRERIRYEDGQEVSRQVEDVWLGREPQPRIEGYGTKIVIRTMDTPNGPIEYWRVVEMYATSYSPCRSAGEEGQCYYYTSLRDEVKQGVVAVIYKWFIPMGNHTVFVPGYGHAKISDVGAGIEGRHWIDLGYTDDDWVPWSQWVTVYFTTPVPPEYEILYILPYKIWD